MVSVRAFQTPNNGVINVNGPHTLYLVVFDLKLEAIQPVDPEFAKPVGYRDLSLFATTDCDEINALVGAIGIVMPSSSASVRAFRHLTTVSST